MTRLTLSSAVIAGLTAGCASQAVALTPTAQPYIPSPITPSPFPTAFRVNAPASTPEAEPTPRPLVELPQVQVIDPQLFVSTEHSALTREAEGGNVVVEVTPLDWPPQPGVNLSFQVALNTHSVDLSYDLSQIAALRTSEGIEVSALAWDSPAMGGHHVMGTLTFPPLPLDGASWIELDIYDVAGVPARTFQWSAIDIQ